MLAQDTCPTSQSTAKKTNCAGGVGENAAGCVSLNPFVSKYGGSTMKTKIHIGARVDLLADRHIHATIASVQVSSKSICAGAAYSMFTAGATALGHCAANKKWVKTGWALSGQQHKSQNDAWTKAHLSLPTGTTAIRFVGKGGSSWQGDMAVDNVVLSSKPYTGPVCKCPNGIAAANIVACPKSGKVVCSACHPGYAFNSKTKTCGKHPATGACNFEKSMCGYTMSRGFSFGSAQTIRWIRTRRSSTTTGTGGTSTGASKAQAGSWFMYLETSGGTRGDEAYLTSPLITQKMGAVMFYYHMYGTVVADLAVDAYAGGKWYPNVWKKSGKTHMKATDPYMAAGVNLPPGTTQIRFGGTRPYQSGQGDIAIDSITVKPHACTFTQKSATSIKCTLRKTKCPGDAAKNDNKVDVEDLLAVLAAFGKKGSGIPADITGTGGSPPNGIVDVEDLLFVLANFGRKC